MKKRCFYFALLALSAFFAFLAACGEGEPFNLKNTPEWQQIIKATEDIEGDIIICKENNVGCPEGGIVIPEPPLPPPPPVTPSSSSSDPVTQKPSSSSVAAVNPGTSSQGTGGTSSAGGNSSAGGASSSSNAAASSSSISFTCGSVPAQSITVGQMPTRPTVTCGTTAVASSTVTWSPVNLNNAIATAGTINNITATATCGGSSRTATCAGSITVTPASSSSAAPPATPSSSSTGGSNPNPGGNTVQIGSDKSTYSTGNPVSGTAYTVTSLASACNNIRFATQGYGWNGETVIGTSVQINSGTPVKCTDANNNCSNLLVSPKPAVNDKLTIADAEHIGIMKCDNW